MNTKSISVNNKNVTLSDLCYKPISDKGCIAPSAMDYWKMNLTFMLGAGSAILPDGNKE